MNILYVARFGNHDNADEEAVADAFRRLGHQVTCVEEKPFKRPPAQHAALQRSDRYDLCLFHKWDDRSGLASVRCPAAFWYFDMVRPTDGDPTLSERSASRVRWMDFVLKQPNVRFGFCTDGDWVETGGPNREKLVFLPQGADQRIVGPGTPAGPGPDVLFTGMVSHGRKRADHVTHLRERWGDRFHVVGDAGPRSRVHGRPLADLLCSARVVVAPDGPSTDRYASNRVWQATGFGAFLVHPRCEFLGGYFTEAQLVQYRSRADCDDIIDHALTHPDWRAQKAKAGYVRTVGSNLYVHRVADLLKYVGG